MQSGQFFFGKLPYLSDIRIINRLIADSFRCLVKNIFFEQTYSTPVLISCGHTGFFFKRADKIRIVMSAFCHKPVPFFIAALTDPGTDNTCCCEGSLALIFAVVYRYAVSHFDEMIAD